MIMVVTPQNQNGRRSRSEFRRGSGVIALAGIDIQPVYRRRMIGSIPFGQVPLVGQQGALGDGVGGGNPRAVCRREAAASQLGTHDVHVPAGDKPSPNVARNSTLQWAAETR